MNGRSAGRDPDGRHGGRNATGTGAVSSADIGGDVTTTNIITSIITNFPGNWRWLLVLLPCALFGTLLLFWPEAGTGQQATAVTLFAVALALAAAALRTDRKGWVTLLSLLVLGTSLTGWGYVSWLGSHGDIDVTGRIVFEKPVQAQAVEDGDRLRAVLETDEPRNTLSLTLGIADSRPESQNCVLFTEAELSLPGVGGQEVTVQHGRTGDLHLGGERENVHVDIAISSGRGCLVDVSIPSAVLRDR